MNHTIQLWFRNLQLDESASIKFCATADSYTTPKEGVIKRLLILEFNQWQTYAGSSDLSERGEALERLTVSGLGSLSKTELYPQMNFPQQPCQVFSIPATCKIVNNRGLSSDYSSEMGLIVRMEQNE